MQLCAVDGCGRTVRKGVLMCRPHWFEVSPPTQQRVYRTYNDWKAMPTLETVRKYREAVEQAKTEVAAAAGRA